MNRQGAYGRWLAALGVLILLTGAGEAKEDEFIYVDRMPEAQGTLTEDVSGELDDLDLVIGKRVFRQDFEDWVIATHVMLATCSSSAAPPDDRPYILAIQYLPRRPNSMEMAGLHDVYKEVYVEDRDGRVRLYEDMTGHDMIDLTSRFRPVCLPV